MKTPYADCRIKEIRIWRYLKKRIVWQQKQRQNKMWVELTYAYIGRKLGYSYKETRRVMDKLVAEKGIYKFRKLVVVEGKKRSRNFYSLTAPIEKAPRKTIIMTLSSQETQATERLQPVNA